MKTCRALVCGPITQFPGEYLRREAVQDHPRAQQRGLLGPVIGWRAFDDLDAARPGSDTILTRLSASRGSSPPGSGHPVPGTNPASMTSISKDRCRLGVLPCDLECHLGDLFDADPFDVTDGDDRRLALSADLHPSTGRLPAADADLHQVGRGGVLDVGGVKPRLVCIRSSRSDSWVSTWRSKWMMPTLPSR